LPAIGLLAILPDVANFTAIIATVRLSTRARFAICHSRAALLLLLLLPLLMLLLLPLWSSISTSASPQSWPIRRALALATAFPNRRQEGLRRSVQLLRCVLRPLLIGLGKWFICIDTMIAHLAKSTFAA